MEKETKAKVKKTEEVSVVETEKEEKLTKNIGLDLEKLETEIRRRYREFTYNDQVYKIYLPSIKMDDELTRYKAKITSEIIRDDNYMLRDELLNKLRKRGVWDDNKDKREKELQKTYSECLSKIFAERAKSEPNTNYLSELAIEKSMTELEMAKLGESKNELLSVCAENRIDELVTKKKLSLCIKTSEDELVWKSLEDLENYEDKAFVNMILQEAMYFWAGLNQSMFDPAPGL